MKKKIIIGVGLLLILLIISQYISRSTYRSSLGYQFKPPTKGAIAENPRWAQNSDLSSKSFITTDFYQAWITKTEAFDVNKKTEIEKISKGELLPKNSTNFQDNGTILPSSTFDVKTYKNPLSGVWGISYVAAGGYDVMSIGIGRGFYLFSPKSKYIISLNYHPRYDCQAIIDAYKKSQEACNNSSKDAQECERAGKAYIKAIRDNVEICSDKSKDKQEAEIFLNTLKFNE